MSENEETLENQRQRRICFLIFLSFILLSVLGLQLWNTQVLHGHDYEDKAKMQSLRKIRIPPLRGSILTADGVAIAGNRVSWDLQFHPSEMRRANRNKMVEHIMAEADRAARCIGRENQLTEKDLRYHLSNLPGIPLVLFRDLNPQELLRIKELYPRIEGMEIANTPVRKYPFGSLAIHLIGYTRQSDPSRAEDRLEFNYYVPDLKGIMGLEKMCDDALRGSPGQELVMVNSAGFVSEMLEAPTPAREGEEIHLTLDLRAQQIAEKLLQHKVGSIVVMDTMTGAVKAMASSPTFTAEDFRYKKRYHALAENPDLPFLNRATMGVYMPGSVIKPFTGLAALASGVTPDAVVRCTGRTRHGYGNGIACNNRYGHGDMDLMNGLKKSCNVYFIENGVQCGIDALSTVYASAGLGSETGIEIAERKGYCPANGPKWNASETAFVSFGQGKILVTPLQVATAYAALANGGTLWRPYIIDRISAPGMIGGKVTAPQKRGTLLATPEALNAVREGLFRVVNEDGGSGVRARISKTTVYGKTGTADVDTKTLPTKHVWFAGFAENPVTKRTYSIAVLIERGDSGGGTAAPLVGAFFDQWFPDPPAPPPAPAGS